jgi:transcriptional regulator with XRE-family HTH domain
MNSKKNLLLNTETIGQRLSKLRKSAGLTQQELADKLDISRSSLAEYERGRLRLHDDLLIKLTAILKVSADEILGVKKIKDKEDKPSLRFQKRLKEIEKLPEIRKKAILRTLDDLIFASEKKE